MPLEIDANSLPEFIGKEVGLSAWQTIDQQRINQFADLTGDHQFIHVDLERAAATPLGGTIAHGFLTLSMLAPFAAEAGLRLRNTLMGLNYGCDKLRFLNPVRAGRRIRARFVLADVQEKAPGQYLIRQQVTIEIEGEKRPALVTEWLGMVYTA